MSFADERHINTLIWEIPEEAWPRIHEFSAQGRTSEVIKIPFLDEEAVREFLLAMAFTLGELPHDEGILKPLAPSIIADQIREFAKINMIYNFDTCEVHLTLTPDIAERLLRFKRSTDENPKKPITLADDEMQRIKNLVEAITTNPSLMMESIIQVLMLETIEILTGKNHMKDIGIEAGEGAVFANIDRNMRILGTSFKMECRRLITQYRERECSAYAIKPDDPKALLHGEAGTKRLCEEAQVELYERFKNAIINVASRGNAQSAS